VALTTPDQTAGVAARSLTASLTSRRTDVKGRILEATLLFSLLMSLLILLVLVIDLIQRSWPVWTDRPVDFLTSGTDINNAAKAGVWQGIKGTLILCAIVAVVALPLGIACAVYLEEYAGRSAFAKWTRINVRNLAGVPSIVYGILGLVIFVKALDSITQGRSVFAGGLALSALVLPIVVITASEALRAVPRAIREGALGVGATEWETVRHHVLPAAAPGILTGTVLALARAAGEAAPILLVGAATGLLRTGNQGFWDQLTGRFTAMPVLIFSYARVPGEDFQSVAAAAALVLLVLIIGVNAFAIWLRNRYERKW
jgi:phosphate transport system permease protein